MGWQHRYFVDNSSQLMVKTDPVSLFVPLRIRWFHKVMTQTIAVIIASWRNEALEATFRAIQSNHLPDAGENSKHLTDVRLFPGSWRGRG